MRDDSLAKEGRNRHGANVSIMEVSVTSLSTDTTTTSASCVIGGNNSNSSHNSTSSTTNCSVGNNFGRIDTNIQDNNTIGQCNRSSCTDDNNLDEIAKLQNDDRMGNNANNNDNNSMNSTDAIGNSIRITSIEAPSEIRLAPLLPTAGNHSTNELDGGAMDTQNQSLGYCNIAASSSSTCDIDSVDTCNHETGSVNHEDDDNDTFNRFDEMEVELLYKSYHESWEQLKDIVDQYKTTYSNNATHLRSFRIIPYIVPAKRKKKKKNKEGMLEDSSTSLQQQKSTPSHTDVSMMEEHHQSLQSSNDTNRFTETPQNTTDYIHVVLVLEVTRPISTLSTPASPSKRVDGLGKDGQKNPCLISANATTFLVDSRTTTENDSENHKVEDYSFRYNLTISTKPKRRRLAVARKRSNKEGPDSSGNHIPSEPATSQRLQTKPRKRAPSASTKKKLKDGKPKKGLLVAKDKTVLSLPNPKSSRKAESEKVTEKKRKREASGNKVINSKSSSSQNISKKKKKKIKVICLKRKKSGELCTTNAKCKTKKRRKRSSSDGSESYHPPDEVESNSTRGRSMTTAIIKTGRKKISDVKSSKTDVSVIKPLHSVEEAPVTKTLNSGESKTNLTNSNSQDDISMPLKTSVLGGTSVVSTTVESSSRRGISNSTLNTTSNIPTTSSTTTSNNHIASNNTSSNNTTSNNATSNNTSNTHNNTTTSSSSKRKDDHNESTVALNQDYASQIPEWEYLWDLLRYQQGWSCVRSPASMSLRSPWWYLPPNGKVKNGARKDVHYFETKDDVIKHWKKRAKHSLGSSALLFPTSTTSSLTSSKKKANNVQNNFSLSSQKKKSVSTSQHNHPAETATSTTTTKATTNTTTK